MQLLIFHIAVIASSLGLIFTYDAIVVPLENTGAGFVANIGVGTPEQKFRVLIDTASAETWLTSESCKNEFCIVQKHFKKSLSSTYHYEGEKWTRNYTTGG